VNRKRRDRFLVLYCFKKCFCFEKTWGSHGPCLAL